jgi:type I restriction enzyme M protein
MSHSDSAEVVKLYGRFTHDELSKSFDNADFGFTRVTVERPLRLRFEVTASGEAQFLEAFPNLRDDLDAIREALGRQPRRDWNAVWVTVQDFLHARRSRWRAPEERLFRAVFTRRDPDGEPVAKDGRGEALEPDADLRFFENVPLKEDVAAYFEGEVRPHVPDAWMDRAKDKVGYEIKFNRYFYKHTRPLEQIDADLRRAEDEIQRLLRDVTA